MTLREKVRNEIAERTNWHLSNDGIDRILTIVFDHLAEPSEAAIQAGAEAHDDFPSILGTYRAVLATARREASAP